MISISDFARKMSDFFTDLQISMQLCWFALPIQADINAYSAVSHQS